MKTGSWKAIILDLDGTQIYHDGKLIHGFASSNSGKYQAVAALGELLQISLEEMISFGDDENDYEIIKMWDEESQLRTQYR